MPNPQTTLYGEDAAVLHRDEECTVYCLSTAEGEVRRTVYPVFPGISLIYNDAHQCACRLERLDPPGLLEIHHCREGRIEYAYGGEHYFLAPGDLSVVSREDGPGAACFPTGHYHGITVTLDPKRAPDCLSCILQDVDVRPGALAEKFCAGSGCFVARSSARVEHIFSELYAVPDDLRRGYFKVKVLELLLFLSALDVPGEKRVYSGAQVRLAQSARDLLLQSTEDDLTTAELAQKLGASASQLAASFRGVYGMTPTARCSTLRASSATTTRASLPVRSAQSSVCRPAPTARARSAIAAHRGRKRKNEFWSLIRAVWSG